MTENYDNLFYPDLNNLKGDINMGVPNTVQWKLLLLKEEVMGNEKIPPEVKLELSRRLNQLSMESGEEVIQARESARRELAQYL